MKLNKWVRRGILILLGLLLAVIYSGGYSNDLIVTPILLGMVIGILSAQAVDAYINSAIILSSELIVALVISLSGHRGLHLSFPHISMIHRFVALALLVLTDYSMEIVAWLLGVFIGLGVRRHVCNGRVCRLFGGMHNNRIE